jgi:uncharacterized protein YjbJ (UPF0337 family)
MSDHEHSTERTAGGLLGKAAGRAKEAIGSALGNSGLDRKGRLQQVRVEAENEAVELGQVADEKDAEGKLANAQAETETERRKLELELSRMTAEERIERERAQAQHDAEQRSRAREGASKAKQQAAEFQADRERRHAKAADAEEVREAAALEKEAKRAEQIADAMHPEASR